MKTGKSVTVVKRRYELVPPDGGWAYMIWISMIIVFIVTTTFMTSLGLIFIDFFIQLNMGTTEILFLNGVNGMCVSISSFLVGPLSKMMSMRKLAFLSSTFLNVGVFCTIFVNSRIQLIICQGLLQNVGVGILYNVACTCGNDYFLKKRFLIMSLAQTIGAVTAIIAPWMVNWTAEIYGFRGTLILVSAVSLHAFVASALIQPVKWHLKRVYVSPETIELIGLTKDHDKEDGSDLDLEPLKLDSFFPCVDINLDSLPSARKENTVLLKIKKFFDWPFLMKFLRTCTCLGVPLTLNSDVIFTIFLPQYLYTLNWSKVEVAWALSLMAFGDIATRLFLTIGSTWLKNVGNHLIYIIGMAVHVIAQLVMMATSSTTIAFISISLIGFARCIIVVLMPLVFSDVLPPEQYARGFGFSMLFYGITALTLGPAIGAVHDATDDYTIMFYILNLLMAVVTVAWSIELFRHKKPKKVVL